MEKAQASVACLLGKAGLKSRDLVAGHLPDLLRDLRCGQGSPHCSRVCRRGPVSGICGSGRHCAALCRRTLLFCVCLAVLHLYISGRHRDHAGFLYIGVRSAVRILIRAECDSPEIIPDKRQALESRGSPGADIRHDDAQAQDGRNTGSQALQTEDTAPARGGRLFAYLLLLIFLFFSML